MAEQSLPRRRYLSPLLVVASILLIAGGVTAIAAAIPMPRQQGDARAEIAAMATTATTVPVPATSEPNQLIIVDKPEPTPAGPIRQREIPDFATDLTTVQGEVSFQIWLAQSLPKGFKLDAVRKYIYPPTGGKGEHLGVVLDYRSPDGLISVNQHQPPFTLNIEVPRDRIIREINLRGQRGALYTIPSVWEGTPPPDAEQGMKTGVALDWTDGTRWLHMTGWEDDTDAIVQIAESLAP